MARDGAGHRRSGRRTLAVAFPLRLCCYVAPVRQYLDLLGHVLHTGVAKEDRTGTGTLSVFGYQMRFDLADGFPALTTKRLHLRSVVGELLWFLRGDTNVAWLHERGITIWDEWADAHGELGPIYGHQWRSWPAPDGRKVDQIAQVVEAIRSNPHSRRHLVSAWNVADLDAMALPPCHVLFQFYVRPTDGGWSPGGKDDAGNSARTTSAPGAPAYLDCQLYQRSADVFLGVPFNIASYALLTEMVAQVTGLRPGHLVHTLGDAHLYRNHEEQARLQLGRAPRPLPTLHLTPHAQLDEYDLDDVALVGYDPHPAIRAPIAV